MQVKSPSNWVAKIKWLTLFWFQARCKHMPLSMFLTLPSKQTENQNNFRWNLQSKQEKIPEVRSKKREEDRLYRDLETREKPVVIACRFCLFVCLSLFFASHIIAWALKSLVTWKEQWAKREKLPEKAHFLQHKNQEKDKKLWPFLPNLGKQKRAHTKTDTLTP